MVFSPLKTFGEIVGGVKSMFWMPCAYKPLLYVETFAEAALLAFLAFEQPDPKHTIHKATGKSAVCHFETFANDLEVVEPTWQSQAREFIFEFDKTLDVAVFWMFVADVIGEGLMRWHSMFAKLAGCNIKPNPNVASGHGMTFGEPGTTDWGVGCHTGNLGGAPSPLVPFDYSPFLNGNCSFLQTGSLSNGVLAIPTATRWVNSMSGAVQKDTTVNLSKWSPSDTPMSYFPQGRTRQDTGFWHHELMSPIGDRFNRITGYGQTPQYAYEEFFSGG